MLWNKQLKEFRCLLTSTNTKGCQRRFTVGVHRKIIWPLLFFFIVSCGQANTDKADGKDQPIEAALAKIETSPHILSLLNQCPAKYYASAGMRNTEFNDYQDLCREKPGKCLRKCENRKASYCQSLAYVIQRDIPEPEHYSDALFAHSCALGIPSGCTNRAAGISHDEEIHSFDIPDCLVNSYKITCEDGDAWGCTMYGLELLEQESPKTKAARKALNKSCRIAPEFEACQRAKSLLAELNEE